MDYKTKRPWGIPMVYLTFLLKNLLKKLVKEKRFLIFSSYFNKQTQTLGGRELLQQVVIYVKL